MRLILRFRRKIKRIPKVPLPQRGSETANVAYQVYTKPKVVFGFGESGLHPLIRQFQALDLLNF
jgi:hypothetical protein